MMVNNKKIVDILNLLKEQKSITDYKLEDNSLFCSIKPDEKSLFRVNFYEEDDARVTLAVTLAHQSPKKDEQKKIVEEEIDKIVKFFVDLSQKMDAAEKFYLKHFSPEEYKKYFLQKLLASKITAVVDGEREWYFDNEKKLQYRLFQPADNLSPVASAELNHNDSPAHDEMLSVSA